MFRKIGRARLPFNLAALESIYIKMEKPPLYRRQEGGVHIHCFDSIGNVSMGKRQLCARVSDRPIGLYKYRLN